MFSKTKRQPIERLDVADLHFADEMAEGRLVELPGRGTAFVRIADGPTGAPTIVLVHGLFATADLNWSLAVPELARRFRVVAPDLRGHGRGLRPTRRFSADECADDLAAMVSVLGLGRVIVAGYSLGGVVAQVFARRHPQLVAGLVLGATACAFDVPTGRGLMRLVDQAARLAPERIRRSVLMALLAPKSANTERGRWLMSEVRRHDTMALLDAVAEAARFDSRPWLAECNRPSAVIITSEDKVVAPETQRALARTLGRPWVHEVAGDHFVCIKRPAEFNRALLDACDSVLEGARAS